MKHQGYYFEIYNQKVAVIYKTKPKSIGLLSAKLGVMKLNIDNKQISIDKVFNDEDQYYRIQTDFPLTIIQIQNIIDAIASDEK